MINGIVAYYPYTYNKNAYQGIIQEMISEQYFVIDYNDIKEGIFPIKNVDAIYLNWIEDTMDERDRKLIIKASAAGIRIYWTFHNRVSHNRSIAKQCRENILFLMQYASGIIILSLASTQYLYDYMPDFDKSKIHYLPHPEYIGNHGALENRNLAESIAGADFVFGFIGSIREDKNIELIIKAFQNFPHKEKSVLFIVGGLCSSEYLDSLRALIEEEQNIFFVLEYIPDYIMKYYVESADVLVLPYDLKTSMNSGVMMLAFSYKRSVIVSDISMIDEFDTSLIYHYSYVDEEMHLLNLTAQMERAYTDGRNNVRSKGELLYEEAVRRNSKENVKGKLYRILDTLPVRHEESEELQDLCREYRDKDLWRIRCAFSEAWLWDIMGSNRLMKSLKENHRKNIAIYGFGKYGKLLYQEMLKQQVLPACIIDRNAGNIHESVPSYTIEELQEKIDFVIVTTASADIKLIKEYCSKINKNCYVCSLGDI